MLKTGIVKSVVLYFLVSAPLFAAQLPDFANMPGSGATKGSSSIEKSCEAEGRAEGWEGDDLKKFVVGCVHDFENS